MTAEITNILQIKNVGTFVIGEVKEGEFEIGKEVCFKEECICKTILQSYFAHNQVLKEGERFSLPITCSGLKPGDVMKQKN